jgi:AcrR family transcriptional regulator
MKSPRVDANPRKHPTQARAKATVDAIVTAAAQILIAHGYERTTTARVARRAGVSVGSLYQYFPNKEALVAALIERHANELVCTIHDILQRHSHATLAACVRAAIDATITAHRIDPRLHKILHEQVPRVGQLARAMRANEDITQDIERSLRAHADELHPAHDPAVAAIVIVTVLDAIAHKAVLERSTPLAGKTAADEAYVLVMSYLTRPASGSRTAGTNHVESAPRAGSASNKR